MSDDIREVPCPETCRFRDRKHVHLEADHYGGQIWGVGDDGQQVLLDPWDLERNPPVSLVPARPRRRR